MAFDGIVQVISGAASPVLRLDMERPISRLSKAIILHGAINRLYRIPARRDSPI